jgi:DNA-binding winged helix-turn-helix (wHTH) protein/tetratricopeptide (TPR) repeat protein
MHTDSFALHFDAFHLTAGVDLLYRGETVIPLEPRAVRVLRYLVEHHDRVLSKEELLEEVWSDVFTTDGVLKKAVSQIRRTLGDDAEQSRFITTYHGRGYRFIAPVSRRSIPAAPADPVVPSKPPVPAAGLLPSFLPNYDQLAAREAEMLTLRAEWRSALEGSPRPVAIVGESGIGKTQLVRHFRRWATEQGALPLYGRFFDYRGARLAPYELFIDLLRSAVGAGDAPLRDAIEAGCGIRLPAELFEDSSRSDALGGSGNVGDHFRFVVPICRAWLALSRRQPIVLAFDDLHWADAASLDVIGCLMRMLETEPLMLIMTVRSDEAESAEHPVRAWLEEHAARRMYTTLPLQRLDEADCREVIGTIFGIRRGGEIPRNDVEKLFRLTNGNPYFLVETLRLLVGAGAVVPESDTRSWKWKGVRDLVLPETIVTAARAKIGRLPERVRAVVDAAAVIGEEFHVETLRRLVGQNEAAVELVLSEGVRSGVLSIQGLTPGEDCRFQHSILRHVVYDAIPPHRRRILHARTAAAIEAVYGAETDRVAEALAAHHSAAGDARRSFEAGMRAWRTASSRSEWRKAVALIERAEQAARILEDGRNHLSYEERIDLLLALGETWRAVGKIRESASVVHQAVSLAAAAGDMLSVARALFLQGLTETALSHYVEARASVSQALDLFLESGNGPGIARALVHLAVVEAAIGNYERAASLVEELRAGDPSEEIVAQADAIVGWSLALRGQHTEGAFLLERALEYYDRKGDVRERALLLRRVHWTFLSRGQYETAIALAVRARSDSATVGDVNGEAKANMGIGQSRVAQGLHDEGISYLTRAVELLKSTGDGHCEAECLWLLARARYENGAIEEAAPLLDRALTMIRRIGDRDDEFRMLIDRSRLRMLRGDVEGAEECATTAHAIAVRLNNREGIALATLELASLQLARGHGAPAAETAARASAVLEELQSCERWRASAICALAERSAGNDRQSRAAHARAAALLDEIREQLDPDDALRRAHVARNHAERLRSLAALLAPADLPTAPPLSLGMTVAQPAH